MSLRKKGDTGASGAGVTSPSSASLSGAGCAIRSFAAGMVEGDVTDRLGAREAVPQQDVELELGLGLELGLDLDGWSVLGVAGAVGLLLVVVGTIGEDARVWRGRRGHCAISRSRRLRISGFSSKT